MAVILLDVGPSESLSVALLQGFRITGMSLQASASEQLVVTVWAEDGEDLAYAIGILSEEEPIVQVLPPVVASDESELVLRHDGVAATVRFYGIPNPPPLSSFGRTGEEDEDVDEEEDEDEEEEEEAAVDDDGEFEATVLDEDEAIDEQASWVEFRPLTEEEEAELYDSDNDQDDEDGGSEGVRDKPPPPKTRDGEISTRAGSLPLVAAPAGAVVPDGQFLGPARFAAVENTAGFMRLAAAAAAEDGATDNHRREVTVLYRYTRFSRTWSGRRGVEACRRTKLHHLRFAVPPAGDMASSLAWVGASLRPLIYPALFRRQLQEVWAILAAPAAISAIPPQATRLQVIVDVSILRREDYTQERMAYMRGALEAEMQEAWPELYHVGMELHLPEPVQSEEEQQGEDASSAKRRKIDDDVDCSLCFYPLEGVLAAWPGCRHVFHGECVEKTLARSDMCPLCRTKLSDQFVL